MPSTVYVHDMQARAVSLACFRDLVGFSEYMGYLLQKDSEPSYIKAHVVAAIKVLAHWDASAPDGRDQQRMEWLYKLKIQMGKIVKAPRPDSKELKEQGGFTRWCGL